MSNAVDQRVVEMRFDNSHFESNVAQTMSTLDKLKAKLNLQGTTKGLEGIDAAARKVNMSGLGSAVDTVSAKFSALQVMGVTALANITNSAVNAGKNIVRSLTITPIKSGFNEYELKMGSIQTIMAGTGESLAVVNQYLNELNEYSDKTIYSFQDMTNNIGKFTNAGVKLEDAVAAIKGISNEAAISGANATQASHAMYNFAQALSSGYVKLIDWKSIENAQMATVEFKQQLIDTAVTMGTLTKASDGMYKTLEGKALNATKGFNDTLQDQWMTSEVLITTLKKYSDESTEIGAKATEAATKVKTFTQLMDTLKESAQSGWAQTWELFVGDFEEARDLFTELSDIFGEIIGKSADRRNALFGDALSSNWEKLTASINEAGVETEELEKSIRSVVGESKFDELIKDYGSIKKAAEKSALSSDVLKKALDGIAGSSETVSIGFDKLSRTLWWGHEGEDVKQMQEILSKLGHDLGETGVDGIIGAYTSRAIKEFQKANGIFVDGIAGPKTIAALKEAAKGIDGISTSVESQNDDLKKNIESWKDLIDAVDKTSGRELLLESFMNIVKAIQRPLAAVGEAFRNIFSISPNQLYKGLEKINKLTKAIKPKGILDSDTWTNLTDKINQAGIETNDFEKSLTGVLKEHGVDVDDLTKKYGSLGEAFENGAVSFDYVKEALLGFEGTSESLIEGGEVADKVRRSFEGLFAALKLFGTAATIPLKLAFNVASKILGKFGLSFLDVTANIGDSLVDFSEKVDSIIGDISDFIADGVMEWIAAFKETEFFQSCAALFESASETITGAIDAISQSIDDFSATKFAQKLFEFGNFLSDIASSITHSETFVSIVNTVTDAFSTLSDFFSKFKLPSINLDKLKTFFTKLKNLESKFNNSTDFSFSGILTGFGQFLKGEATIKWNTFSQSAINKFVTFWNEIGEDAVQAFEACKRFANSIKEFIFGTEDIKLSTILDLVEKFLGIIVLIKTLQLLNTLVSPLDNITDALDNFAAARKWDAIGDAFKSMAIALAIFAVSIHIIGKMGLEEAIPAATILIALIAAIGVVVYKLIAISSKMSEAPKVAAAAASLLMVVMAIALMVGTIKALDEVDLKDPVGTFSMLAGILIGLSAGIKMIGKAGGSSFASVAAVLTLITALNQMINVIKAYNEEDWPSLTKGIKAMIQAMVVLALGINLASRGIKGGANARGLAMAIFAMVLSLRIMVGIMKDFAKMSDTELEKGSRMITRLLLTIGGIMALLNLTNKPTILEKGQKTVNGFAGFAAALLAVVASIWLLGKMGDETLLKGGVAVGAILLLFTHMMSRIGNACSGLKMGVLITALIGMGLLMAEAAGLIKLLEGVPWQNSLASATAMSVLLFAITGVLIKLNSQPIKAGNVFKWIGAIATLGLVMAELALVLRLVKDINPVNAIGNTLALVGLMSAMALVLTTLTKHRNGAKSIYKWVGAMITLGLVVAELAIVLNLVKDIDPVNSIGNVIALSGLMAAMTLVLTSLSGHRNGAKSIYKWIGAMATLGLVVAELAGVLYLVKDIDPVNAIGNVIALSGLLLALTASLTILSSCKVKTNFSAIGAIAVLGLVAAELVGVIHLMRGIDPAQAIPQVLALSTLVTVLSLVLIPLAAVGTLGTAGLLGVGTLATLATSLFILVGVLAAMTLVTNATENAKTLAGLVTVLSLLLLPLTLVGAFAVAGLAGVGVLATLMASLFIVVGVLAAMQGVDGARTNADIIIDLLDTLADMVSQIASFGLDSVVAVTALNGMMNLVKRLGIFVTAIGWLADKNAKLEDFVNNGLELFKKLAKGLGEMISDFGVGITSDLPEIAENLSEFAENLTPFVDVIDKLGDDVVDRAKNLGKAISELISAVLYNSFTPGTLSGLGTELSEFATNVSDFLSAMTSIKPEVATSIESFCNAIGILVEANKDNAWANLFAGEKSLSTFGTSIASFATGIKTASEELSQLTDTDVENIKKAAAAGMALADLNKAIPREGGGWQQIAGEADIAEWGKKIVAFADSLITFSAKVSGNNIDTAAIEKTTQAATLISDLNNSIPKDEGLLQDIVGSADLQTWGTKIVAFADSLIAYSDKVSGVDFNTEAITASVAAVDALAGLNGKIPTIGGLIDWFAGSQDLESFGTGLVYLATGISTFANAAAAISDTAIEDIRNTGTIIDELTIVVDKLTTEGGLWNAITGEKNPQTFGVGLSALAKGIKDYCAIAAEIGSEDSLTAIENSKAAVEAVSGITELVPAVDASERATYFATAAANLALFAERMGGLAAAGYDYSGIESLKTAVTDISGIVESEFVATMNANVTTLQNAIINVETCATKIQSLNGYTYTGITNFKNALNDLSSANIDGVISAFSGKGSSMSEAVDSIINAMAGGISGGTEKVSNAMANLMSKALSSVTTKLGGFTEAGGTIVDKLTGGISSKNGDVEAAGETSGGKVESGFRSKYDAAVQAGAYVGSGLAIGVRSMWNEAYQSGVELGNAVNQGISDTVDLGSPSKVAIRYGKWIGEGLAIGVTDMTRSAYNAGASLGDNTIDGMSKSIRRISSAIESDIDAQPTIRPVLDLSNVRNGAGAISSMLNFGTPVDVLASTGAISTMMNRRGQNGANDDVVYAINKLQDRLDNIGNTTYQVNGVTYDDGTAVSNAVRDLTRAVKIGRRV